MHAKNEGLDIFKYQIFHIRKLNSEILYFFC